MRHGEQETGIVCPGLESIEKTEPHATLAGEHQQQGNQQANYNARKCTFKLDELHPEQLTNSVEPVFEFLAGGEAIKMGANRITQPG